MTVKIAMIGSSGALGSAFTRHFQSLSPPAEIHMLSSRPDIAAQPPSYAYRIDYNDEQTMERAAMAAYQDTPFDLLIVTTGLLHDGAEIQPEKSLRDLSEEKFHALFAANTIVPALAMKHFLPLLHRNKRSVFAALSARVGSISDNHIGGWYAYRASKAALNMVIKCAAIETARKYKQAAVIGLHPGTVDTDLSKPFQSNVRHEIFTPDIAVSHLMKVIDTVEAKDTGKIFGWDGKEIMP